TTTLAVVRNPTTTAIRASTVAHQAGTFRRRVVSRGASRAEAGVEVGAASATAHIKPWRLAEGATGGHRAQVRDPPAENVVLATDRKTDDIGSTDLGTVARHAAAPANRSDVPRL